MDGTNKYALFGLLLLATAIEASGDALVRMGLGAHAWPMRLALFLAGGVLLFGYGLTLNLAPVSFGRVVGLYIATLFVVWQFVNYVAFRAVPGPAVYFGGALIVIGGLVVTFGAK